MYKFDSSCSAKLAVPFLVWLRRIVTLWRTVPLPMIDEFHAKQRQVHLAHHHRD